MSEKLEEIRTILFSFAILGIDYTSRLNEVQHFLDEQQKTIELLNTPKHETVSEWENRTGESYPDDALVWSWIDSLKDWDYYPYGEAKTEIGEYKNVRLIVANHHGKPEEIINES